MMRRSRLGLVLLLMVLLSALARAQDDDDYDDSDDDTDQPGSASLYFNFDQLGGASVSFGLPERPSNWDDIRQALAVALHCPEQSFTAPYLNDRMKAMIDRWPASRREKYLQYFAGYQRRQLVANCASVLAWNGFGRSGSFDFSALSAQLKPAGIQDFWISIAYPNAKLIEYSGENLGYPPQNGMRFLGYHIVTDGSSPAPIHFSFGIGRRSLYSNLAIAIGFVLLPVGVTLYIRRTALLYGKADPTAAWFSYFRTINWLVTGSFLLWITSGLGARQALQDLITFAFPPGWLATLLDAAVVIGPAFLIYFACVAVSYPLHVHLRGSSWTRREFLIQTLVTLGAQALPLMFFLAAITNISKNVNATATFFLAALFSWFLFRSLKMRVTKSYPYALTRGELRDRVFALAAKAGVNITQIFVLPTGKSQVANAYASGGRAVMFTDYLLQHLTRREVEGVAAHEIAHLQLGHVRKRALTFYGALAVPAFLTGFIQDFIHSNQTEHATQPALLAHFYSSLSWFWDWSQRDFILMLLALLLFYFVSRRFEYAADERGAELTGDAEAQITGLLKLSRLNLMPIQWGRSTGTWLTHPSMLRRAERIAASSGMSAGQLNAILERYRMEVKSGSPAVPAGDDHYAAPEAADPENLLSTASKQRSQQFRLWTSLLMHVAPPALCAFAIQARHLGENAAFWAYVLGALLTPLLTITYSAWLGVWGRTALKRRLVERFRREGATVQDSSISVGFSPGAVVRFYGSNHYNWDIGLLEIRDAELVYRGEQIRFAIPAEKIKGICIGQGGPSWWKFPRVYIRWIDAEGKPAAFSLANLEPCSIWKIRQRADDLCARLNQWRTSSKSSAISTEPVELPPTIGEITSRSPREFGALKINLSLAIYLVPLAIAANALFRTDSLWYLLSVVALTRVLESIPFWRFHDRILSFAITERSAFAAKGSES